MARTFVRASSQYLQRASAVVSAYPFTMACWFNVTMQGGGSAGDQCLMNLQDSADAPDIELHVANSADTRLFARINGRANGAVTSTGYTDQTWAHACAVYESATSRAVFLNAGGKGTDTVNLAFPTVNTTAIGRCAQSSPDRYVEGRVAEAAIWNVALSDDEVLQLSKGIDPRAIRAASIVAYWPLVGNDAPELDRWKDTLDLTVTGATKGDHARMYYRTGRGR